MTSVTSLQVLACVNSNLGADDAISLFNKAIAIKRKIYGADKRLSIALVLHGLGNALAAQGNLQEAKKTLEYTLEIYIVELGENHNYTKACSRNLANLKIKNKYLLSGARQLDNFLSQDDFKKIPPFYC